MPLDKSDKIWHNGRMIAWDDARIHVLSHVVSYGSAWFEGIRCYATPQGPSIFRLSDHIRRLEQSTKIYRVTLKFSQEELEQACIDVIRENRLGPAYIRPIVLRGYGSMGLGARVGDNPIEVYVAAWRWGSEYLGNDSHQKGVDVCISSWRRIAPDTMPAMAKAASNYMNSQLMKLEAIANNYTEAIALDATGQVSEGSGENVCMIRGGTLYTPPLSASLLPGLTRDSVLRLARDMSVPVVEQNLPRESLYVADELFFCGTAVEITPIRSVDRVTVKDGLPGPITRELQRRFFAIAKGEAPDPYGWLTPVPQPVAVA